MSEQYEFGFVNMFYALQQRALDAALSERSDRGSVSPSPRAKVAPSRRQRLTTTEKELRSGRRQPALSRPARRKTSSRLQPRPKSSPN